MAIRSVLVSAALVAGLSGCSVFDPDYYNCKSQISSYAEASRSSVTAQITDQPVEVRFNSVSARCYDEGDMTIMEIGIGLKVLRDLSDNVEVAPVNVPLAAAIIDGDDNVISHETFSYDMQFTDGGRVIYPLVRRDIRLPKQGRVVLALTPEQLYVQ